MKTVMTIVGTRPEIIKLSRVISELEKHTKHILVHTGQNYDYELNEVFFNELGIKKPNYYLEAAGRRPAETIANVIQKSDELMNKIRPDALLLYGDTNSCLAALSAKRLKIPLFHMEAGNRCFDQRVPEEINRKVVDHLSDINMTLTEHARRYLIAEGIKPETIIKTGSSMLEVLNHYKEQIQTSDILHRLEIELNQYFIVSAHREENIDSKENFANLLDSLNSIAERFALPIIVSTHPRAQKKLKNIKKQEFHQSIQFMKPMGFFDYIALQKQSYCAISDSGTITEEASILNFPAITIRQAHERPEGMDEGTLIMSGLKADNILDAISVVTEQHQRKSSVPRVVPDYDVPNVSQKVVRIILSYIGYVNRTVWKRY